MSKDGRLERNGRLTVFFIRLELMDRDCDKRWSRRHDTNSQCRKTLNILIVRPIWRYMSRHGSQRTNIKRPRNVTNWHGKTRLNHPPNQKHTMTVRTRPQSKAKICSGHHQRSKNPPHLNVGPSVNQLLPILDFASTHSWSPNPLLDVVLYLPMVLYLRQQEAKVPHAKASGCFQSGRNRIWRRRLWRR
jgi:hypothetical protein